MLSAIKTALARRSSAAGWVLAAVLALGSAPALASGPEASPLADLEAYIERARDELGIVGISVAVVKDGEVVYSGGSGFKDVRYPDPVGADTLFQIGSTTKAFTAAALGILVDEGKVDWDDPVVKYLPDFQLPTSRLTRRVTIRDTLSHRSGIVGKNYHIYAVLDPDTAIDQLRYSPVTGRFRNSYGYSNLMYGVAGKVIEAVSGQSWHDFVQERLLQPLQMTRSSTSVYDFWDREYVAPTLRGVPAAESWHHTDARDPDVAMPHMRDGRDAVRVLPWQAYEGAPAAGAIVSSANDLANWMLLNLNGGRFQGQQILQPETVRETQAVQNERNTRFFPFGDDYEGYTLGWNRARYHDRLILWHSGGMQGFPAYVSLMPEDGIGVAVLVNHFDEGGGGGMGVHQAIALHVADRLLNLPGRDWIGVQAGRSQALRGRAYDREMRLQARRALDGPTSVPLQAYAGVYEDTDMNVGPLTVTHEDGGLVLRYSGEGSHTADLEHWHRDWFRLKPRASANIRRFVEFDVNSRGEVVSFSFERGDTFTRRPQQGN